MSACSPVPLPTPHSPLPTSTLHFSLILRSRNNSLAPNPTLTNPPVNPRFVERALQAGKATQRLLAVVARASAALRPLEELCDGRAPAGAAGRIPGAFGDVPAMSKVFIVACARRLRMLYDKFYGIGDL